MKLNIPRDQFSLTLCNSMECSIPCPSPSPGACSNSCPLSQWYHWIISSCCPLLLQPSIFPSIRVFSSQSALCIRWPKYWSFNLSISPSNEYSGLISFRIDWFDLFAVQGTLKSLLQHHSLKASILWHSAFFMDQKSSLLIAKTLSIYLSSCHAPVFPSVTAINLPKPERSIGFWTDSPLQGVLCGDCMSAADSIYSQF